MSYLNVLRLHFSGRFQANVSTVNNNPAHFDNATFKPSDQLPNTGDNFNPQGDASFRLLGCTIRSASQQGVAVTTGDPILACMVADADDRPPAKLVDLDSEQQLVSEIWGLSVRIVDQKGNTLVRGEFEPAPFIDIWQRATHDGAAGDVGMSAAYQSVLTDLVWSDVSHSPFLTALKAASQDLLSIKFNVDGINLDFQSPHFMTGRIVGTIGPANASEPHHLVLGRQFTTQVTGDVFPSPANGIFFFPAVVDEANKLLLLDLGNALPCGGPGSAMIDLGDLRVSVGAPSGGQKDLQIGTIQASVYTARDWYENCAGVVAMPLTGEMLSRMGSSPLRVTGKGRVSISEPAHGAFVRADMFVYRLSPGDDVSIPIHAMQWGKPLEGAEVDFAMDLLQLQSQGRNPDDPEDALSFSAKAVTDANGVAQLRLRCGDPGTPRWADGGYGMDGQLYGIRAAFADAALNSGPVNQWNFISILLWSGFTPSNPVTWSDIQPVLQQYANLYPVMNRFFNLADPADCEANAPLLKLAFGLDPQNPNSMPVTRDLSPAKRKAILAWLDQPVHGQAAGALLAEGLGGPAMGSEGLERAPAPNAGERPVLAAKGGKAAALARRLVVQQGESQ